MQKLTQAKFKHEVEQLKADGYVETPNLKSGSQYYYCCYKNGYDVLTISILEKKYEITKPTNLSVYLR